MIKEHRIAGAPCTDNPHNNPALLGNEEKFNAEVAETRRAAEQNEN